jgi:hypothetical protein
VGGLRERLDSIRGVREWFGSAARLEEDAKKKKGQPIFEPPARICRKP